MKNWVKAVISLAVPLAVGAFAGLFTRPEIDGWYRGLQKPSWQPPNAVFGPVWTVLYILMGVAFYLLWRKHSALSTRLSIRLWIAQLVFNFFWSFIFFWGHQIGWALADILVLWLLILLTILSFARVSKAAAWLMVSYLGWVSFAAVLNFAIYRLNV